MESDEKLDYTFFAILIVQKEFTVSLLCYCLSSPMFRTVEGLFEARFETWSENSSRTGLMRIAPWCFSCTMRFHLQTSSPWKTFKRGASCGSHDFLGSARGWGTYLTVILWLKSGRFTAIFGGDACHPHRTGAHIGSLFGCCLVVPKENGKVESETCRECKFKEISSDNLRWSGPNYCGFVEDFLRIFLHGSVGYLLAV